MNCQEFLSFLPRYPDDLTDEVNVALLAHAADCVECAEKLAAHEAMLLSLQTLDDDLLVPEAFSTGWRASIREHEQSGQTPWYARWQGWTAAAALICIVISGTALMRGGYIFPEAMKDSAPTTQSIESLSLAGAADMPYEATIYDAEPMPADAVDGSMSQAFSANTLSKRSDTMTVSDEAEWDTGDSGTAQPSVILRTASISLDSDQYDADMTRIQSQLDESQGWIEYQSVYGESLTTNPDGSGRYTVLRVRVPADSLDALLSKVSTIGRITSTESSSEDISGNYYDVHGRLAMYTAQRERLTELLADAQDMQDIIEIEGRLSEVQYAIESLTGQLHQWDSSAQNATVSIHVTEVAREREFARPPLSQRIAETFDRSWLAVRAFFADMLVFLVMVTPYFVFLAVLIVVIYLIYRIVKRGKQKGGNETK